MASSALLIPLSTYIFIQFEPFKADWSLFHTFSGESLVLPPPRASNKWELCLIGEDEEQRPFIHDGGVDDGKDMSEWTAAQPAMYLDDTGCHWMVTDSSRICWEIRFKAHRLVQMKYNMGLFKGDVAFTAAVMHNKRGCCMLRWDLLDMHAKLGLSADSTPSRWVQHLWKSWEKRFKDNEVPTFPCWPSLNMMIRMLL